MKLFAGDNAGIGIYKCTHCGRLVALYDDHESLPFCPRCKRSEFNEIY